MKILLLGKNCPWFWAVNDMLTRRGHIVTRCAGNEWGKPLPPAALEWEGDLLISFLSRWIIPPSMLAKSRLPAINFHPGPPEYPGVGCLNWALYDNAHEYGATCHIMTEKPDTGPILRVERFPIRPTDTVESLMLATYQTMVRMVADVFIDPDRHDGLSSRSAEVWTGRRRSRKDLDDLMRIPHDLSGSEVRHRIRATAYGEFKPYVDVGGVRFYPA